MFRLMSAIFKITIASLMAGAALSALNISAADLLLDIGLIPDKVFTLMQQGAQWAIPNLVLGSLVVIPVWLVAYLFRPPRS
jgi:hypothetical protein